MSDLRDLQARLVAWHEARFPDAQPEHVVLKTCEEVGEVAKALNGILGANSATGGGDVPAESADTVISLLVLLGRWWPEVDLLAEIEDKVTMLETPGAHTASARA